MRSCERSTAPCPLPHQTWIVVPSEVEQEVLRSFSTTPYRWRQRPPYPPFVGCCAFLREPSKPFLRLDTRGAPALPCSTSPLCGGSEERSPPLAPSTHVVFSQNGARLLPRAISVRRCASGKSITQCRCGCTGFRVNFTDFLVRFNFV